MDILAKNATREGLEVTVDCCDDGECMLEGVGATVVTGVGCKVEIGKVG